MKEKIVIVLKVVQKLLPYIIAALGGSAVATFATGCKIGSVISLVTPV